MKHYRSLAEISLNACWLTIGSFDGVHRGHQAIISQLVRAARTAGEPAVVLTFFPHPAMVLRNRQDPLYLSTPEERAELLGALGVDVVITYPFTLQVASQTALEFMSEISRRIHPRHLLVGYDFALGRGREGNVARLQAIGTELGYTLDVISQIELEGEIVSSSQIRAALADGNVLKASRLLGRAYQVSGEVVHGDGRGRLLGIPTANLELWPYRVIPKAGVYACQAQIDGQTWKAVVNIGVRPTFDNQATVLHVEAHVLDLDEDLYGQQMQLAFIERLRDEQRFPSVEALVEQIRQDIQHARYNLSHL
jgi:riboflavin kinase/FMN adenylyltransferase